MVEQENSNSGTMWSKSGTVEQSWWNSVVEQWNSHGGTVWWTVEQSWRNTVVEQCNKQWNSKVEQCGGTVEQ